MAGRFTLLTDEHIDYALVSGLRARGWEVVRVVDHPDLGQQTDDEAIFAYAAEHDWVWLTRDERATWRPGKWLQEGMRFRGMLCWSQRHDAMTIGEVLRFIERLGEEDDPFGPGIRYIRPG